MVFNGGSFGKSNWLRRMEVSGVMGFCQYDWAKILWFFVV